MQYNFLLDADLFFSIDDDKISDRKFQMGYRGKRFFLSIQKNSSVSWGFFFSTNSEARSFGIFEIFFVHVQLQFLFNSFLMKMLRLEFVEREWQMIGTNDFCRCYKRPKN